MSKQVWYVKWNRPSKVFKGEKIGEWETFPTEELAKKQFDKVSKMEEATDLEMGETEVCYLSLPVSRRAKK